MNGIKDGKRKGGIIEMKRAIFLVITIIICFVLASCGKADPIALPEKDDVTEVGVTYDGETEYHKDTEWIDRVMSGIEVYEAAAAPKLLMSGDHGREDYDEVGAMKNYAIENGVPSENVFMDHAGFSTYETVYRAKEIFEADKVIIVTQEYHLYRALYIAEQLGVDAYGVSSDLNTYAGQSMRDFREVLARCKDWVMCIFKPEPTYLGEAIPVSGNGDLTND